ncbi:hypothetical protein C7N43_27860 [Sphingobacteriales bacterium UPWRP_1]|nr:hypothetical protein BVG80_04655 [Sphingobacteriales bacterium TSM_CSM]PSJ73678.1 hypothetical protein C7N43_27860 [Sphingobacteriales bacterium UPWRP_1]
MELKWSNNIMKANALLFVALLAAGGLLFIVMPKQTVSENENRKLAQLPPVTFENLWNGKLAEGIDAYCSDNFIFRNGFIDMANRLKALKGFTYENVVIYNNPKAETEPAPPTADTTVALPVLPDTTDTDLQTTLPEKTGDAANYDIVKSVVIYNNRAVQVLGGSRQTVTRYAAVLNRYNSELSADVQLYAMAIPIGSDFYLPPKITRDKQKEKKCIEYFYGQLDSCIVRVPVYEELEQRTKEYIQFNTDHHWTGLGAYYGYKAFCKAAGITPLPLTQLTRKVIHGFVGSLYYYTLNEGLLQNPDSVEYFKTPVKTSTIYFVADSIAPKPASLYAEYAKGKNAYGVFLGADYPLMKIVTNVKNGKRILVMKDSYGNAFAPYLTSHFEEVYIADYRYFWGNIKKFVKKNNITDLLFAHNTYVINKEFTVKRETMMLKSVERKIKPAPKDTLANIIQPGTTTIPDTVKKQE